jgi:hypothetical protein
MRKINEASYLAGQRALTIQRSYELARELSQVCEKRLGKELSAHKELLETQAALLNLCRELGVEVPQKLHPADIIERYLLPYLVPS